MAETQEVSHAEQPDKVPKVAEVQETREVEEEDTKLEVNDDEQVEEAPEDVAEDASSSPPSPRDTPPSPTSTHSAPPPTTTAHSAQDESTSVARVREAQTPTVAQGASSPSSSPQRPRRRRRQASGQAKQVPKTTAGSLWGALNPFAWGGSSTAATAESGKGAGKAVSSSKEERRVRGGGAAGGGPAAGGGVDGTSKYTYKYFASKMKHPKAKPLLDLIRRFVQDFAGRELDAGAEGGYAGDVHRFLKKTFLRMVKHELWSRASPEERDATFESLEKFVTGKLYDKLLRATPEERARDVALERKVAQLTFLQPEHLDIPPQYVSAKVLQLAADEILRIATFKSPRDKIICLLNCCKILMDHLNTFRTPVPSPSVTPTPGSPAHTSAGEPADAQAAPAGSLADSDLDGNDSSSSQTQFLTRPPSVDDMLPLMILVLIKAQLPHLLLHTQYMSEVRHPAKLAGEASYYLTSLHSAVAFLETVQSSNLSISAEEFEQRMAERGAELDREEAERRKQEEEKRRQEEEEEQQRAAQYDAASAAVDAAAVMATGRGRMPLKDMFKFLDVSADELRVADVPRLLADYKRIAHALIHLRRSSKPRRT